MCICRSPRADYGDVSPIAAPELPAGTVNTVAAVTLRQLFLSWKLDAEHAGTAQWNPLGRWIQPGSRVVLKPNWVLHANQSGQGMDCLITHTSLIEAILDYVALARPGSVVVGDAPVQSCDFDRLRREVAIDRMAERFTKQGLPLQIRDFRRTVLAVDRSSRQQDRVPLDRFVLFNLADESLLAPLDGDANLFRVTMYDPEGLQRTHHPGVHQYLVARDVIEADTIINVPKLKCHKKAGITGALKNLIGINGNKEYLPHHRKGGAGDGGDCYAGGSMWKRVAEDLLDSANRRNPGGLQQSLVRTSERLAAVAEKLGSDRNLEGSWYGNDTIWRTCLDLQRILAYGTTDGVLNTKQQRHVLHITDAIIGGEGDGPLAPLPVASSFLTASASGAAAEWVHARLMGFDPAKIALTREAFGRFSYPLTTAQPDETAVLLDGSPVAMDRLGPFQGRRFLPPAGWAGHCELDQKHDAITEPAVVA